jgi:hypothetical protein
MLLGEVVSKATVPYESIMREAVRAAGYDHEDMGMDWRTVNVPMPHLGLGGWLVSQIRHVAVLMAVLIVLCSLLSLEHRQMPWKMRLIIDGVIARNGSKSAGVK